jgi:hypothetical protein
MRFSKYINGIASLKSIVCDLDETRTIKEATLLERGPKELTFSTSRKIFDSILEFIKFRFKRMSGDPLLKELFASRGNIEKIKYFKDFEKIIKEYKFLGNSLKNRKAYDELLDEMLYAYEYCIKNKKTFEREFKKGSTAGITIYIGIVSNLISFKTLFESFTFDFSITKFGTREEINLVIKEEFISVIKEHFLYERIQYFNKSMSSVNFDKILNESALLEVFEIFTIAGIALGTLVLLIIGARDLVEFIFNLRTQTSDWLELQASILEFNISKLEKNQADPKIIEQQKKYVNKFYSLSEKIKVDMNKSLKDSKSELDKENKNLSKEVEEEITRSKDDTSSTEVLL